MSTTIQDEMALKLLKADLGISSDVRDEYLNAILNGVSDELNKIYGIEVDYENISDLMFVVDYSVFRYEHREYKDIPRHLERRLHNLIITHGKTDDDG